MKYIVEQKEKELNSASFEIKSFYENDNKGRIVGKIVFTGNSLGYDGTFDIEYNNQRLSMSRTSKKEAIEIAGEYIDYSFFRKPFRPYRVVSEDKKGVVFNFQSKTDIYHFLRLNNNNYYLYVIGFGEKGMYFPIYKDDVCIAEITKDCITYDDKHNFNINIKEEKDALMTIIFSIYVYVFTYYKPGIKIISSKYKDVYITTDKELLKKCKNPYYLN